MYTVGDTQWLIYPVGDGGGEEDLCHVPSGGRFPRFSIIAHSYCEQTIYVYVFANN